jgi:hypothetical protein
MNTASLSFDVRLVNSPQALREACAVRARAYGHHRFEGAARFGDPEPLDASPAAAVLLARDKASRRAVGTARIQSSAFGALKLESSLIVPAWLSGSPRAEITRLAVVPGADPLVKLCLMKASYLYCLASQLRWMVIGARNEALVRNYRRLGFRDVLAPDVKVPLAHAAGLLHRILALDLVAAERTWLAGRHPLYAFMIETYHADLRLFAPERDVEQQTAPLAVAA